MSLLTPSAYKPQFIPNSNQFSPLTCLPVSRGSCQMSNQLTYTDSAHDTGQELASCSWHRVTMLPLPHLPQDQLRKDCNTRHLCDLLITPLSARTHLFSDTGRIPIAQLMAACLPALAINGNHSEQPTPRPRSSALRRPSE